MTFPSSNLVCVVTFLQAIGLPVEWVDHWDGESFMDLVRIQHGGLVVQKEAAVADVLHEAGHLAVVPAPYRTWIHDDVDVGLERMLDAIETLALDPDDALPKAAMQAGEAEATAWAWAAGVHLGLAPHTIIADSDYQGMGQSLRVALGRGCDPGIRGLCRAGFCGQGSLAAQRGLPVYPALAFWLQGGPSPEPSPALVNGHERRPRP